ncbi:MAG: hypothetical protein JOY62_08160 [Acidobacteriaceae bacterium]|nr:hypothetical protein [Acidobacteriaceae bacterium]MBV9779934.1 hypothetical protein [Acidobacteriaceae bacterium]
MRIIILVLTALSLRGAKEQIVNLTLPSGIHVSIAEAPFRGSGISVQGCDKSPTVCRIAGKPYGLATGLPRTYVRSIIVRYGASTFSLDSSGIYDAEVSQHASHPQNRFFGGSCQDAKNCVLRAVFGDAANAVAAEWVVMEGVAHRTVLTGDSDLVEFFRRNIDPPTYE